MHGVSEVIAIILILMITIAIAGLAYTFMSSTMSSTTSAASSAVDTTTSSMLASFTIESMDIAKVYVRNTGQNAITSLSVYVNDEPAIFSLTPAMIATGQVGTVTIYSFIPDGSTVKIASPNGFSTSKVATPCSKAIGCWKFDEGNGLISYDSSPYGNIGTLTNGPNWTNGQYGGGIQFDGVNDYLSVRNESSLNLGTGDFTVSMWVYLNGETSYQSIFHNGRSTFGQDLWITADNTEVNSKLMVRMDNVDMFGGHGTGIIPGQTWTLLTITRSGTNVSGYINGAYIISGSSSADISNSGGNISIGRDSQNYRFFNGTIDEVRIYNRAIY